MPKTPEKMTKHVVMDGATYQRLEALVDKYGLVRGRLVAALLNGWTLLGPRQKQRALSGDVVPDDDTDT